MCRYTLSQLSGVQRSTVTHCQTYSKYSDAHQRLWQKKKSCRVRRATTDRYWIIGRQDTVESRSGGSLARLDTQVYEAPVAWRENAVGHTPSR